MMTPIDAIADVPEVVGGTVELHPVRQAHRGPPVAETHQAKFVGYLVMLDS